MTQRTDLSDLHRAGLNIVDLIVAGKPMPVLDGPALLAAAKAGLGLAVDNTGRTAVLAPLLTEPARRALARMPTVDRELALADLKRAAGRGYGDTFRALGAGIRAAEGALQSAALSESVAEAGDSNGERMSDVGNAQVLVDLRGHLLRWCPTMSGDGWLLWDGTRWKGDDTLSVVRETAHVAAFWRAQAVKCEDAQWASKLNKWATKCESATAIRNMLDLARSDLRVGVRREALDADPLLFNAKTHTLELATGIPRAHQQHDLITRQSESGFVRDSSCPTWLAFLQTIMAGNTELISFLQRAVGYSMTGDTSEQCLFILHGNGQNGKGVFMETIRYIMGDYARNTQFDTFTMARDGGLSPDLAALVGARMVTASEGQETAALNEGVVKQITGEDPITVNPKYKDVFTFLALFKVWLSTNHKPVIRGTDKGIWRRLRLIPFAVTIPDHQLDLKLKDKLRAEAEGILLWCLAGYDAWKEHGLKPPAEVLAATKDYQKEMDVLAGFLEDECHVGTLHGPTPMKDLYKAYVEWAKDNGLYPKSNTWFGKQLTSRNILDNPRHSDSRTRLGIALIRAPKPVFAPREHD